MRRCLLPLLALAVGAQASVARAAELRYAEDQAPGIVNPLFTTTMSEARLGELVFEALFTDDRKLSPQGDLAESWEVASDGRSMVVQLRDGVTWHDGEALTPDDVVFTVRALQDPQTSSPEAGRVEAISRVTSPGPGSVRFEFDTPQLDPAALLTFKILPAHRFSGTAVSRSDRFRASPIGTGPYEVTSFNDDGSVSLQRYSRHRDTPAIATITLREVPEKSYQAKLLLYESLEALVRVLPRDLAMLQSNRSVDLYPYQTNSWWYVGINLQHGALAELPVRQALSRMVDAEALLAPIGTGARLSGPFVPASPFYNHEVEPTGRNPVVAGQLLQEAGFERVDGAWARDGQPLALRLAAPRSMESIQEVVINLQSQLQRSGVALEVEFLDDAAWRQRVWVQRDYDLLLSQWSFDRSEDVREQFHSRGARNFGGYANPAADDLLDRAAVSRDPQEKKALLRELHALVATDAPMVFLWTLDSYSAVSRTISQVEIHPFYYFTWVTDWVLE
jgi:peptide/nickel transport system substrate-binding protein